MSYRKDYPERKPNTPDKLWGGDKLKLLIKSVIEHKEIYNPSYMTNDNSPWREIAQQMGCKVIELQKAWKLHCSTFRQFYNKHTLVSGRQHYLHKEMEPLIPFVCGRKTKESGSTRASSWQPMPSTSYNQRDGICILTEGEQYEKWDNEHKHCGDSTSGSWNTREFINEVYLHSRLYDESHPHYNPKDVVIWNEIGELFGVDGETCRRRWRYITGRFYKCFSKTSMRPGRKHRYHNEMSRFYPLIYQRQIERDMKEAAIQPDEKLTFPLNPSNRKFFLDLVLHKPELYDRSHPLNKGTHKFRVWQQIAKDANMYESACKAEWLEICRTFLIYHNDRNATPAKYGLTEEMLHILPYFKPMAKRREQADDDAYLLAKEENDLYEL